MTTIELTRTIDGEPMMSADALALLFGIEADRVSDYMTINMADGAVAFPPKWMRAGRRRSREAAAATGSSDVFEVLAYWARRDLGAETVVIDQDADQ